MNLDKQDWRSNKNLVEKMKYIYASSYITDMTVKVDYEGISKEFKTHRLILSMGSFMLKCRMNCDFAENSPKIIEVLDIRPEIFDLCLKYMYGFTIEFKNSTEAWNVFEAADKYLMLDLAELCLDYVSKNLDTIFPWMSFEMSDWDLLKFKDMCLKTNRYSPANEINVQTTFPSFLQIIAQKNMFLDAVKHWKRSAVEKKASMMYMHEQDWRDINKTLINKVMYIYSLSFMADVTIKILYEADSKEYTAHSLVLTLASSVFEAMLTGNFRENYYKTIEIRDVYPEIFDFVLKFMYGYANTFENCFDALEAFVFANKYLMLDLKEFCLNYLQQNLETKHIILGLQMSEHCELPDLREMCIKLISKNTKRVVTDKSYLDADIQFLQIILEQERLSIKECDLFKAVELWIKSKIDEKGEDIKQSLCGQLLPKIRYLSMTLEEFNSGPAMSGLMRDDHVTSICRNIECEDAVMPEGFISKKRRLILECDFYDLKQPIERMNKCGKTTVRTSGTVKLNSITVFTQEGIKGEAYYENICITIDRYITSSKPMETVSEQFEGEVSYSSTVTVPFKQPFTFYSYNLYHLTVSTNDGVFKVINFENTKFCYDHVMLQFLGYYNDRTISLLPFASFCLEIEKSQ